MKPQQLREELQDGDTRDVRWRRGIVALSLTLAGHATNVVLTAYGGIHRATEQPWVSIAASGKAGVEAAVVAKYLFYQMPVIEKKWCGYCVVDALMHIGAFALTLPEAARALSPELRTLNLKRYVLNPEPPL